MATLRPDIHNSLLSKVQQQQQQQRGSYQRQDSGNISSNSVFSRGVYKNNSANYTPQTSQSTLPSSDADEIRSSATTQVVSHVFRPFAAVNAQQGGGAAAVHEEEDRQDHDEEQSSHFFNRVERPAKKIQR